MSGFVTLLLLSVPVSRGYVLVVRLSSPCVTAGGSDQPREPATAVVSWAGLDTDPGPRGERRNGDTKDGNAEEVDGADGDSDDGGGNGPETFDGTISGGGVLN